MKRYNILFVFAISLLIGVIATFPMLFSFDKSIYSMGGDSYALLYHFWWIKFNPVHLMYPDNFLFMGLAKLLVTFLSETVAYNIFIILGFISTGYAGFLIAKKITGNCFAGIFAAVLFCLMPFRQTHSLQHLNFSDLGLILFFIYYLILSIENPNKKNIILSGLFFVLATLWNLQYGFFAAVIFISLIFFTLISFIVNHKLNFSKINFVILKQSFLTIILVAIVLSLFNFNLIKDVFGINKSEAAISSPVRDVSELTTYSAKWYYYLLPSSDNPIFGKFSANQFDKEVNILKTNRTEQILYLGWIPLLLAIYAISKIKNFTPPEIGGARNSNIKKIVWFLIIMGITGLILSFSDTWHIFGKNMKSPAQYIFDYIPFFRVYTRLGLIVNISVILLSAIGFNKLIENINNKNIKNLIIYTIMILSISEFLIWPSQRVVAVNYNAMPSAYKALEMYPKGILIEYPLLPNEEPRSYDYLVWQRLHGFPLLYSVKSSLISENFRREIVNIEDSKIIDLLRANNVKYIIIHQDKYLNGEPKKYPAEYNWGRIPVVNNLQLVLIGKFDSDELYELKNNND